MSRIDWIVLIATLAGIILYGLYKSRTKKNLEGYFLMNRSSPWYHSAQYHRYQAAPTFLLAPGCGLFFRKPEPFWWNVSSGFHKLKSLPLRNPKRFDGKTRTFIPCYFIAAWADRISISPPYSSSS
jgi:hypothetical protein